MAHEARDYGIQEGNDLVGTARHIIESAVSSPKFDRRIAEEQLAKYGELMGCFVVLKSFPTGTMRGYGGDALPDERLKKALVSATLSAISGKGGFVAVSSRELSHIIVGVHLVMPFVSLAGMSLSAIEDEISGKACGLAIKYGFHNAIMLPFDDKRTNGAPDEILSTLCVKAGLPAEAWKNKGAEVSTFGTIAFCETEPRGSVMQG